MSGLLLGRCLLCYVSSVGLISHRLVVMSGWTFFELWHWAYIYLKTTSSHSIAENQLRLLHYPRLLQCFWAKNLLTRRNSVPVQKLRDEEVIRIGAHSDFGSITLLLQDEVGGLEVEDPNRPGEFIVGLNNLPLCRRPSRDQIYRVRPQ